MCRHVGYLGPSIALDELLLKPAHSLLEQTWSPRDMRGGGTVNVDGFGVGWYPRRSATPTRYRAAVPMWTDSSFAEMAAQASGSAVLGAVRSATVGMPVVSTACAPLTDGRWLFSHNGRVDGWPESLAKPASRLDVVDLMTLDAPVDSAVVWALLRQRLDRDEDPCTAVRDVLDEVIAVAPGSRMNLLLTDGTVLIATAWTHSLSVKRDRDAVIVSSEPFGAESGWEEIPDRHLVVADTEQVHVTALTDVGDARLDEGES
jgi:gamma-glutamyl hercynylcysteine S-oxide hydrolase